MKKNTKPLYKTLSMFSQAYLSYVAVEHLLVSDNLVEAIISAFALLWVMTDVAIWFYRMAISPMAKEIIKSNK